MTLWRKRRENNIGCYPLYTEICDDALESVIYEIKESHPDIGERMLMGFLRSRDIIVKRSRVCDILHKKDPLALHYVGIVVFAENHTV